MHSNFHAALELLDESEGGYVDHPKDPGGATNRGVTNRTYQKWLRKHGKPARHVKYIGPNEVEAIYKELYWDAVQADALSSGIDYMVFDAAVNSGPRRAALWLQKALGGVVVPDGKIGPKTLAAVRALGEKDEVVTIDRCMDFRLGFMRRARHPITKALLWPTFKGGWSKRVEKVRTIAKDWAPMDNTAQRPTKKRDLPTGWELFLDMLQQIFQKD